MTITWFRSVSIVKLGLHEINVELYVKIWLHSLASIMLCSWYELTFSAFLSVMHVKVTVELYFEYDVGLAKFNDLRTNQLSTILIWHVFILKPKSSSSVVICPSDVWTTRLFIPFLLRLVEHIQTATVVRTGRDTGNGVYIPGRQWKLENIVRKK
jgi:hypothetical protein